MAHFVCDPLSVGTSLLSGQ